MRTEMCQVSPIRGQIVWKLDVMFPVRHDTFTWPTRNEPLRRMAPVLKWYIEDILLCDRKCCKKSPYKLNIFIEFVEDYDISRTQCRIENLPNGAPVMSKMWHAPPDLPDDDARFIILVCHRWWTIHFAVFHHVHIFYRSQGDDETGTAHHGGYGLGSNKSTHTWNVHRTDV